MKGIVAAIGAGLLAFLLLLVVLIGGVQSIQSAQDAADAAKGAGGGNLGLKGGEVPEQYREMVEEAGQVCDGISAPHIAAQIEAESTWNPNAVSPATAVGLAQFMPGTWPSYATDANGNGKADPREPADAIAAQAKYMCELTEQVASVAKSSGKPVIELAWAAYNAGPGAVQQYGGIPPYGETQDYVKKLRGMTEKYSSGPTGGGGGSSAGSFGDRDGKTKPGAWGGYDNGKIPADELTPLTFASGESLRPDAAEDFEKLNKAYKKKFGQDLVLSDSYRSYDEQVTLKGTRGKWAATPGTSNHGWAMAVDIREGVGQFGTTEHKWMQANAPKYGWVHPPWAGINGSLPEPWHWEYWGVAQ